MSARLSQSILVALIVLATGSATAQPLKAPPILLALTTITPLALPSVAARMVPESRLALIGSGGGSKFSRKCPDKHVLTGIRFRTGAVVDGIGIRCRPVNSGGSLGAEINSGSMAGGNGGTSGSESCYQGNNPNVIAKQTGGGAGVGIAALHFTCQEWFKESESFGVGVSWGFHVRVGTVFKSSATCPTSKEPAVGIYGRHGSFIDAVGLICENP